MTVSGRKQPLGCDAISGPVTADSGAAALVLGFCFPFSDTSSLPYGYLLQTDHAIGNRLRRDIGIGTPVSPSLLETPATVKRGQQVTLEAKAGGMIVRMAGVAKSDGVMGQVIPVENTKSQRVVHAVVRTGRTVEVLLQ